MRSGRLEEAGRAPPECARYWDGAGVDVGWKKLWIPLPDEDVLDGARCRDGVRSLGIEVVLDLKKSLIPVW